MSEQLKALNDTSEMKSFYVVSNIWTGRAWHVCDSREQAARNQYLEVRARHGGEVRPEQFEAWPAETWPELSNEKAFDWIRSIRGKD